MKEIQLSQGYVAQVDDENYEQCMAGPKWYAHVKHRKDGSVWNVYAVRNLCIDDHTKFTESMHRFVLGITDQKIEVDHEDHDTLNNQRYNLRPTPNQNPHNRGVNNNNTSGHKGVYWHKQGRKWMAQVAVNGKRIYLGLFTDILDASDAYDAAALKYFGEFACTNAMLSAAALAQSEHVSMEAQ